MKKPASGSGARVKELRDVVANSPGSPKAHLNLGVALMKVGMVSKAEKSLRRALELDPYFAEAWSNLGGVLLSRWDFAGCLEANHRALDCRPDLVQAHYNIGLCYVYQGKAKEVVESFRQVVRLDPTNGGGHYYLAVGLHAKGQFEEARVSLGRAIALGHAPEPEFLKAMESRGLPSRKVSGYAEAKADPPKLERDDNVKANAGGSCVKASIVEFGPGSSNHHKED